MASFGEGLTSGLKEGRLFRRDITERHKEEAQDNLFSAAMGMQAEGAELDAEGQQRSSVMDMFGKASTGDITQAIVDNYAANGGKINEQTYKLATGVASTLFGLKQKETEYQQKNSMFGLKKERLASQIARTRQITANSGESKRYKPSAYESTYNQIKETLGDEAANAFAHNKAYGRSKDPKQITAKAINDSANMLSDRVEGFSDLPEKDQMDAAVNFAKTGNIPEVEITKNGFFRSDAYKLKSSKATPKKTKAAPSEKKSWKDYN